VVYTCGLTIHLGQSLHPTACGGSTNMKKIGTWLNADDVYGHSYQTKPQINAPPFYNETLSATNQLFSPTATVS